MELILAILAAWPAGYFTSTRKRGLALYLLAWAIVFPIQTISVDSSGQLDPLYWVFNALILAGGIGLNLLGSRSRERRRAKPGVAATASRASARGSLMRPNNRKKALK